jgi:hypothetical protein
MKNYLIRRLYVSLGLTGCMLLVGAGFGGGTASAVTVDVACTAASGDVTISPGINITDRTFGMTGTGTLANCVENPLNPGPHVVSATWATTSAGGFGSCLRFTAAGTVDVTWLLAGGGTDTSVIDFVITASILPPTAVYQFVVTSGRFVGDTITASLITAQFYPLDGCLTDGGITQASFSAAGLMYNLA